MRSYNMLGSMLAAGLIASIGGTTNIDVRPVSEPINFDAPKRRRTGKRYPHSSARHDARIARQLAAGQLDYSASKFKGSSAAQ